MSSVDRKLRQITRLLQTVTALALAAVVCDAGRAACPPMYSVEVIVGPACGPLGSNVLASGLNSSGDVACSLSCPGGLYQACTWTGGPGLNMLPLPAGTFQSYGIDITDDGVVLGEYANPANGGTWGFLRNGDTFINIPPSLGGFAVHPAAVNSSHQVCGSWSSIGGLAFRWEDGVMEDISKDLLGTQQSRALDINDKGVVTGFMGSLVLPPDHRAFIWENGNVTDLGLPFAGAIASAGESINSQGHVAGSWFLQSDAAVGYDTRGFFYDGQRITDLGSLPNLAKTFPADINDHSEIVGSCSHATMNLDQPFLWRDGVMYNLHDLIPPDAGINFYAPVAINNQGQIAGFGQTIPVVEDVAILLTPLASKTGDANCDRIINVLDLLDVIGAWGECGSICVTDFNNDQIVDIGDLYIVIENWGT